MIACSLLGATVKGLREGLEEWVGMFSLLEAGKMCSVFCELWWKHGKKKKQVAFLTFLCSGNKIPIFKTLLAVVSFIL